MLDTLLSGFTSRLRSRSDVLWLDLGEFNSLASRSGQDHWQDHGLGLLRTILHRRGIQTDLLSTRAFDSWAGFERRVSGYSTLLMNVRSYTFPIACEAAALFKKANPGGKVLTGGIHATVAPQEMERVADFDYICRGDGEGIIVDLVQNPGAFPRVFDGKAAPSMAEWPDVDRTLWPKPIGLKNRLRSAWPLEPQCGWDPGPVATVLTSRVCPWKCSFCNELSYISNIKRKSVDQVIDELNAVDEKYGPIGSVVIHDSMFFMQPNWLREWLEKYPRRARAVWPYWAAARADTLRQWPDLFERLVRETRWSHVSVGFEAGSDRMLRVLNKECTEADNYFAIQLLNRIGDDIERSGITPPKFYSNIMIGIPGETREDVFRTMRMVKLMKRKIISLAYYAPYPGSALGNQLIAEGKSLMTQDNYHRYPGVEKVKGVDYRFLADVVAGAYDDEIERGLDEYVGRQEAALASGAGLARAR
ncbi:MAG TPA: radical SAM protein [Nitrospirales bacterium]|nr:radical SAM protein [Nitrospirales bacterium]